MSYYKIETKIGNKTLIMETGKYAKQADGAVFLSFGDSRILVTAVSAKEAREGADFFPLTVDYIEKYYASGKIPGGYLKREARPSDAATLTSRLIDRPIRPLFPENYRCETQVSATVLSYDPDCATDQIGIIGASAALMVSDVPFNGPVASCKVARVDGKLIAAPSAEELAKSDLEILVASSEKAVVMVEGAADIIPEDEVLEAIMFGFNAVQPCIQAQKELAKLAGKSKRTFQVTERNKDLSGLITKICLEKFPAAFGIREKLERYKAIDAIKPDIERAVGEFVAAREDLDAAAIKKEAMAVLEDTKYEFARGLVTKNNARIDGRKFNEVRPINCDAGILPRAHGSSVFTRGETQVMASITLGSGEDEQFIDSLEGLRKDKFMLHYNFPQYSVGEVGPNRGPGRREIGHGNLAKRGIFPILPDTQSFPYTIRIVSEVLESNGSSSMGTVCSACLALMDAGVPIKETVAGVAMGLISEDNNFFILTDILGDEDHLGDMDFKVTGTKNGVTAIQMDIKIDGVNREILEKALTQAKEGRLHIINEMEKELSQPRNNMSPFAPRIETMTISTEYIKDVIGPGGKVIKSIIEKTGVKMDINDSGEIHIVSIDENSIALAKSIVKGIVSEPDVGTVFDATVKKIMDFGAFVEYLPGKEGLVHISEIAKERVNKVTDYLKEGDACRVMFLGSDRQGRVKLSIKAVDSN
ncbi:MAG: polyribonucleotide nucleotidyltransferase [Oligoflexia bacterium]|nr:polyribonucleotide nucleotidyltransferase [Oligoflexia bacterium]